MPDITVHRHGDRWSVVEQGTEGAVKEFPTREAAEQAARQMAEGGAVEVVEDDPTGLETEQEAGVDSAADAGADEGQGLDPTEHTRTPQAGL